MTNFDPGPDPDFLCVFASLREACIPSFAVPHENPRVQSFKPPAIKTAA